MNQRPLFTFAVVYLLGSYFALSGAVWLLVFLPILAYALCHRRGKTGVFFILFALALFFGGFWREKEALEERNAAWSVLKEGRTVMLSGTITQKTEKNDNWILTLESMTLYQNKKQISFTGGVNVYTDFSSEEGEADFGEYPIHSVIFVQGKVLETHRQENEGGYDEAVSLSAARIYGKVSAESLRLMKEPHFLLRERLWILRRNMNAFICENLQGEEGGILSAMTLGDKSELSTEAKELFAGAGISHILAISGLHISLIGGFVWNLIRRCGISFLGAALLSGSFVLLFSIFCGGSISSQRAAGMFVLSAAASCLGEGYDLLTGLAVMAIWIIGFQPLSVQSAGFILSFAAVCGVAMAGIPTQKCYETICRLRWESRHQSGKGRQWKASFREKLFSNMLLSLMVQLFLLPVLSYYYFTLPVYCVLLNLVVIPLLPPLLACGLLGGATGLFLPPLGRLFLIPCHFILYAYEALSEKSLKLPFSQIITGKPGALTILVYYILFVFFMRFLLSQKERWEKRSEEALPWRKERPRGFFGSRRSDMVFCLSLAAFILILSIPKERGFEMDMLSVGQGDGIYIRSPEGIRFFIDGGSTSRAQVGKYVLKPFLHSRGIRSVDYWFLTHMDEDHYNGFEELLAEGNMIKRVVLAKSVEKNEAYERIVSTCSRQGVPVLFMQTGDVLRTKSLSFSCLGPDAPSPFSGTNENSLVLHLKYKGFDGIFTGDIGEEQERAILSGKSGRELNAAGAIEILKAAHHGSNYSNCREWLSEISPEVILLSAGKNNRYHHPGREALARMDEQELKYVCTIEAGQVSVFWEKGGMRVERYLGKY